VLKLYNSEFRLANVDGKTYSALTSKYKIHGYPTYNFFIGGESIVYTGSRSSKDIVKWLMKKSGQPFALLNSAEDFYKFKTSADVVVVGLFRDLQSAASKQFITVALLVDSVYFGISSNSSVFDTVVLFYSIVVFKKFDEGRSDFDGQFNADEIKKFILANQLALLTKFNADTVQDIFHNEIKVLNLLFAIKKSENFESTLAEFKEAANSSKGRVIFVFVNIDVDDNLRATEYYNLKKEDAPQVLLISMGNENNNKYKLDTSSITSAVVSQFVEDFFAKKLNAHLFSAAIPEGISLFTILDHYY
jgi:protein disulfide-isomerase A1